jgi:hypothetical protein
VSFRSVSASSSRVLLEQLGRLLFDLACIERAAKLLKLLARHTSGCLLSIMSRESASIWCE